MLFTFRAIGCLFLLLFSPSINGSDNLTGDRRKATILQSMSAQPAAGAISIQYTLIPLGGNAYQYVYSITNNGTLASGAAVKLFDILFDPALYQESSLQIVTPSTLHAQWSEQLLASAPGVPAAYDALAIQGGIPLGTTVSGFSVQFRWFGPGLPGPQPFQVFDPTTFQLLQTGQTAGGPQGAPAASMLTLILIGAGLALTGVYQVWTANRQARAQ